MDWKKIDPESSPRIGVELEHGAQDRETNVIK